MPSSGAAAPRLGAGAGDNAAAALGLGAAAGDVVVSIGTSGTVFAVSGTPTADATGIVAGFADATGRFLPLVCTLNAARVLDAAAAHARRRPGRALRAGAVAPGRGPTGSTIAALPRGRADPEPAGRHRARCTA